MSESPADLLGLRSRLATETGLSASDIGIAADDSHLASGGYHCGGLDLRRINAVGRDDYSIRQARDRKVYDSDVAAKRNFASAMDLGDDWPRGGRAAWIRFNNLVRLQLGAKDPALAAIRGMNYTPNGSTKRRFDCLTGRESSSADTVTWHTHIEWWRDTIGDREESIDRLVQIAIAARDDVALTQLTLNGDDMLLRSPNGTIYLSAGGKTVSVTGAEWAGVSPQAFTQVPQSLIDKLLAAPPAQPPAVVDGAEVAAALAADASFVDAVSTAIAAKLGHVPSAQENAAAVIAEIAS